MSSGRQRLVLIGFSAAALVAWALVVSGIDVPLPDVRTGQAHNLAVALWACADEHGRLPKDMEEWRNEEKQIPSHGGLDVEILWGMPYAGGSVDAVKPKGTKGVREAKMINQRFRELAEAQRGSEEADRPVRPRRGSK